MCVNVNMCVSNELNDLIERHQAEIRSKQGMKVKKSEAGSMLFEKIAKEKGLI